MSTDKKIQKLWQQIKNNPYLEQFIDKFLSDHDDSVQIYLVGGCVRDALMNRQCKDFDLVIAGLTRQQLAQYLDQQSGKSVDVVSRNFGVFKYKPAGSQEVIDIALPRQDVYSQYGLGHKDIEVKIDKVSIEDDLSRRDFTINAMAVNLRTQQLLDLFDGVGDIKQKTIRAVGQPRLRMVDEDPTRMVRAIRFAVSLGFAIESNTLNCIKQNRSEINRQFTSPETGETMERVAREVIAAEFIKGFDKDPAGMIELLDETGVYQNIIDPKLVKIWEGLKTTDQPANFHYEGNVWKHTILALRNIKMLKDNQLGLPKTACINLKLAVFFHDWGKVTTIEITPDGQFSYYNHPAESAKMARQFINYMQLFSPFPKNHRLAVKSDVVAWLAHNHMFPNNTPAHELRDRTVIKYYLEKKRLGRKLLQIGYIDACSSIKAKGPQDFTGIKRSIKKIEEVSARLDEINRNKKIYPLTGKQIKSIMTKIIKEKTVEASAIGYINDILNNPKGSPAIGELKELILEDALVNPSQYKGQEKLIPARKLIENFFRVASEKL